MKPKTEVWEACKSEEYMPNLVENFSFTRRINFFEWTQKISATGGKFTVLEFAHERGEIKIKYNLSKFSSINGYMSS